MNIKNIIIGALAIAFILGFITTCNKDKEIASLKFENGRLDSMRNAANQLVVTQRVELLKTKAEQEQLKAYSDSVFNLTKKQERKQWLKKHQKRMMKTEEWVVFLIDSYLKPFIKHLILFKFLMRLLKLLI